MRREDKVVYTFGSHQQQHDIRLVFRLPALYSDPPVSLAASSQRSTYPENQYPFQCLDLCFDLPFFSSLVGLARPMYRKRASVDRLENIKVCDPFRPSESGPRIPVRDTHHTHTIFVRLRITLTTPLNGHVEPRDA